MPYDHHLAGAVHRGAISKSAIKRNLIATSEKSRGQGKGAKGRGAIDQDQDKDASPRARARRFKHRGANAPKQPSLGMYAGPGSGESREGSEPGDFDSSYYGARARR